MKLSYESDYHAENNDSQRYKPKETKKHFRGRPAPYNLNFCISLMNVKKQSQTLFILMIEFMCAETPQP